MFTLKSGALARYLALFVTSDTALPPVMPVNTSTRKGATLKLSALVENGLATMGRKKLPLAYSVLGGTTEEACASPMVANQRKAIAKPSPPLFSFQIFSI